MTENTDRLTELIRARVEPALKTAFKKHAKNRKLKESELLRRLVLRELGMDCLLYTSPSPRDRTRSRMPSSA